MRKRIFAIVSIAVIAAATVAPALWAQSASVAAEVSKIDKAAGRLTLKQDAIKSLEMPAMTMSWRVKDPQLLEALAVGDRVRFAPARIDGQFVITAISKAPQ